MAELVLSQTAQPLEPKYFQGYDLWKATGKEGWFFDVSIDKNTICFNVKTTKPYPEQNCTTSAITRTTNCSTKNINLSSINKLPITDSPTATAGSLTDNINVDIVKPFCYSVANPLKSTWLKFGDTSIILTGTTTYNATKVNITTETGYAHLNTSLTAPYKNLIAYYPFDIDFQDFSKKNWDGVKQGEAFIGSVCDPNGDPSSWCYHCWSSGTAGNDAGFGNASWFANCGDNSYISVPVSISVNNMTVCAWMYYDGSNSGLPIITGGCSNAQLTWAGNGVSVGHCSMNRFSFSAYPKYQWHHNCITIDVGGDNITYYRDAVVDSTANCRQFNQSGTDCDNYGCSFTPGNCVDNFGGDCTSFSGGDGTDCLAHSEFCSWSDPDCTGSWSCFDGWTSNGDAWCQARDPTYCTFTAPRCEIPTQIGFSSLGYDGNAELLQGGLDEVMVFNVSLNQANITEIYRNQSKRFVSNGTLTWQNINFGGNISTNISVRACQELKGSNISIRINNGSDVFLNSSCKTYNYSLAGIGNISSANVTITLYAGNWTDPFYSSIIFGNITFNTTEPPLPPPVLSWIKTLSPDTSEVPYVQLNYSLVFP